MVSRKDKSSQNQGEQGDRFVYQEFGNARSSQATEKAIRELPPHQQNLRVQASRKGRKGKTVTVISGFQAQPETLKSVLKQLKTHCGAGGTIKDDTMEIQGDRSQQLLEILTKLGYNAKISGR